MRRRPNTWRSSYCYTKTHGVPPAEAELQRYFKASPPPVHNIVVPPEKLYAGAARSIQFLLWRDQLPDLQERPLH